MPVVTRLSLVLLAAVWLLPGFGLIDLTVTWDPEWPVLLEAGWGLFVSLGAALPLLVAAVAPRLATSCVVLLLITTGCLLAGAVAGREPETWWMFVLLALSVWPVHRLAVRQRPTAAPVAPAGRRPALWVLAGVAAPFGLAYWWDMAGLNRRAADHGDITNGVDHYSVQAAVGLFLVALPLVAGWWPPHRRLLGTSAAVAAGYLGLLSVAFPGYDGGYGRAGSVAVMAWAVAVLVASWWPARRGSGPAGADETRPGATRTAG